MNLNESIVEDAALEWFRRRQGYAGKVMVELAKTHAESEFEKCRIVQDRLFESDFDEMIKKLPEEGDTP